MQLLLGALLALVFGAQATAAPKAYVGVFGDNVVDVVDTATRQVVRTIAVPAGPHGLAMAPDGRRIYVSSDGDALVSVIDTQSDEIVDAVDVGQTPHGLAITPDGSRVLVAGFGTDRVLAIDTSTDRIAWQANVGRPHNLAITPDGTRVYAGSQAGNGALVVLDVASGGELSRLPLEHAPRALNVSPDGSTLLYTLSNVDAVQVLGTASNEVLGEIPSGASPHHPVFVSDGATAVVVSQTPGTLDAFNVATRSPIESIKVGTMPHWIGLMGHEAWVTNENSNDISVVDLVQRSVVGTIPVGNAPRKIVVQPGDMR
jgi:YVTN family beta-propeller protein